MQNFQDFFFDNTNTISSLQQLKPLLFFFKRGVVTNP